MLEKIAVRNYQSLHDVAVELLPFTVIVGPTSSGKSAFTRAVRMLTSNQRGDAFVTYGQRTASVIVTTEKGVVSLKRGAENEYTIIPTANPEQQREFTKLAGGVPEEVSEFLGILPRDPLNYASQFDKPYLLDESAGEVARVLGQLTNVNVIFEAAREANRQRGAAAAALKTRQSDFELVKRRIQGFTGLKQQLAAITRAEEALTTAARLEAKLQRLQSALQVEQDARQKLATAEAALKLTVPEVESITAAQQRLTAYRTELENMRQHGVEVKDANAHLASIDADAQQLHVSYAEALAKLSGGIRDHFVAHSTTAEAHPETMAPIIEVEEAAQLSADFIVEVLKP